MNPVHRHIRRLALLSRTGQAWEELPAELRSEEIAGWLEAARASQRPAEVLLRLAAYTEAADRLRHGVRLSLRYPRLVLLAVLWLLVLFSLATGPPLITTLCSMQPEWAWLGRFPAGMVGVLACLPLFLAALLAHRFLGNSRYTWGWGGGRLRGQLEQILWCSTLSHLLDCGQDLSRSLAIAAGGLRPGPTREQALQLVAQVRAGSALAQALQQTPWDPLLGWAARSGENHGKLAEALGEAARTLEDQLRDATRNALLWLQPVALVLVGVLVLATLVLFWLTYYSTANSLGGP